MAARDAGGRGDAGRAAARPAARPAPPAAAAAAPTAAGKVKASGSAMDRMNAAFSSLSKNEDDPSAAQEPRTLECRAFSEFRILGELGKGQFGLVHKAIDLRMGAQGEQVALKQLKFNFEDEGFRWRRCARSQS